MRTFIRHKSHYLSTKWTREPFTIGYPVARNTESNKTAKEEIFRHLFPAKTLTPYDYYAQNNNPEEWPHVSYEEYRRYQQIAIENGPSYTTPAPQRLAGVELLQALTANKSSVVNIWQRLGQNERARLESPSKWQFQQSIRVWQGYEAVAMLKRGPGPSSWNPYPLSGLYPWEIIKDKLRNKDAFNFEFDYYDTLIREAFGRNSTRKAMHIFYTDLSHQNPGVNYNWAKVDALFRGLAPHQRSYYDDKAARRLEQAELTRSPYTSLAFHEYLQHHRGEPRPLLAAARGWSRQHGPGNRSQPRPGDRQHTNSRWYKEQLLDLKTAIVMDYLYYTGGVEGVDSSYNWAVDMAEKTRDHTYMHRGYYRGNIGF